MRVRAPGDVRLEMPGEEARAVVGHQEQYFRERPVQPLGFGTRCIERCGDLAGAVAGRKVTGQQIARVIVDHRHRVPPAVAGNVQVGHVGLPQLVRSRRQELKEPRRLVDRRLAHSGLLQEPRRLENPVNLLVRHPKPFTPGNDRDSLVAPPRIALRKRFDRRRSAGSITLGLRPGGRRGSSRSAARTSSSGQPRASTAAASAAQNLQRPLRALRAPSPATPR